MRIIVIGCGKLGAELSYRLFQEGNHLIVVDQSPLSFRNLHHDFRGKTIEGSGISQSALLRAGIRDTDAVVAVTNSDVINAIVGRIALVEYKVEKIVVRNYDSRYQTMHETFGLPTISSTLWGVEKIESLLRQTCLHLAYRNSVADFNLVELTIPNSHVAFQLRRILASPKYNIISITRKNVKIDLTEDENFDTGDVVHINTSSFGFDELRDLVKTSV